MLDVSPVILASRPTAAMLTYATRPLLLLGNVVLLRGRRMRIGMTLSNRKLAFYSTVTCQVAENLL